MVGDAKRTLSAVASYDHLTGAAAARRLAGPPATASWARPERALPRLRLQRPGLASRRSWETEYANASNSLFAASRSSALLASCWRA